MMTCLCASKIGICKVISVFLFKLKVIFGCIHTSIYALINWNKQTVTLVFLGIFVVTVLCVRIIILCVDAL